MLIFSPSYPLVSPSFPHEYLLPTSSLCGYIVVENDMIPLTVIRHCFSHTGKVQKGPPHPRPCHLAFQRNAEVVTCQNSQDSIFLDDSPYSLPISPPRTTIHILKSVREEDADSPAQRAFLELPRSGAEQERLPSVFRGLEEV